MRTLAERNLERLVRSLTARIEALESMGEGDFASPLRDHDRIDHTNIHSPLHASQRWTNGAAQSIPNNASTVVVYDTGVYNEDDMNNWDLGSGTGIVTILRAGEYEIAAGVSFASNATGYRDMNILQNATGRGRINGAAITGVATRLSTDSGILQCVNGDTISVEVVQTSGGALNIQNVDATFLSIHRIA